MTSESIPLSRANDGSENFADSDQDQSGQRGSSDDGGAGKKQGATGITTVAPYVTGQWGRGNNRLP
jgi:hypothetical protein